MSTINPLVSTISDCVHELLRVPFSPTHEHLLAQCTADLLNAGKSGPVLEGLRSAFDGFLQHPGDVSQYVKNLSIKRIVQWMALFLRFDMLSHPDLTMWLLSGAIGRMGIGDAEEAD